MAQTKRKIEASTIDEVYKEISRLQRLHGRDRVSVDPKDSMASCAESLS